MPRTTLSINALLLKPKFIPAIRRQEAEFAGNRCSIRGCGQPVYGPLPKKVKGQPYDDEVKTLPRGEGAHIFSSSPSGPRGQGGLGDDKLKGANNCLHVCRNCHNLIDSATSVYSVDTLVEMKWLHRTIVKVININQNLEHRLVKPSGTDNSDRYKFEEFLLSKVPNIEKVIGAVPSKPKIDEKTLRAYVDEFFVDKKPAQLESTAEERGKSAQKLKKIYTAQWEIKPTKSCGFQFSYTLTAKKNNGELIRSGQTYKFYRDTSSSSVALFARHNERDAELCHEVGFDITGSVGIGMIKIDLRRVRVSTNLSTHEFLHALSEGAKIYIDIDAEEVIEGQNSVPFKFLKCELEYTIGRGIQFAGSLRTIYMKCLLARSIAAELGVNFLPELNDFAPKKGVSPKAVAGLLASEIDDKALRCIFEELREKNSLKIITTRSGWNIEHDEKIIYIECSLHFRHHDVHCSLHTYIFYVIESSVQCVEIKRWLVTDNELENMDCVIEMLKDAPEGDVLREMKALIAQY